MPCKLNRGQDRRRRLQFESESQNDSRSDMHVVNSATAAESAVVSDEVLKSVPTLNA